MLTRGLDLVIYALTGAFNTSNQQPTQNQASQAPDTLGQTSGAPPQLSQMQQLQLLAAANANQAEIPGGSFSSGLHGLGGLDTSLWNCNLPNVGGLSGGFSNADMMQQQANILQQQADLRRSSFDLTANMPNMSAMDRGLVSQLQDATFGSGLGGDGLGNVVGNLGNGLDALNLNNLSLGNQQALSNAALAARLNALQNGYGGSLGGFNGDLTGGQGQGDLLNGLNLGLLQNSMNTMPLQQQLQLRELQNVSAFGQTPQLQVGSYLTSSISITCLALSCVCCNQQDCPGAGR